jgi:hypothetical protein
VRRQIFKSQEIAEGFADCAAFVVERGIRHRPGVGSIKEDTRDPMALSEQLLLGRNIARDRVRRTRALMIEVPTGRPRQRVFTRGTPCLGYAPLVKIVRR